MEVDVQRRRLDPPAGHLLAEDGGALLHARGIPYGRAARFAAPQPIAPWSNARDATTRGPVPARSFRHGSSGSPARWSTA